jgi:hypothetical protein
MNRLNTRLRVLAPLSLTTLATVAMATATSCAPTRKHSPREPSAPYVVVKALDKLLLLGRQLLVNSSDWNEVARFNKLRPQPDKRWPEAGPIRFLRSTPPQGHPGGR